MRPTIGIIGAGVMGTTHGKAIHALLKSGLIDGEIAAIADTDAERRARYQQASGAPLAFERASELIASPQVNTVYVCTPTNTHLELARQVAAAGKALFCEKPLAFNADDAAAMREAALAAGVTHQVGLVMRFSPVINVTRELVRSADAGRPMTCSIIDDQYFPIQGHYASTWRGDVSQVGAGTLLEHAIHDIDVLLWCFGPVRRVYGVSRYFFEKAGVEDATSAVLEFESGAVASHTSVWHNILHRGSSRRMTVICENAQYSWAHDDYAARISCETNDAEARGEIAPEEVIERYLASRRDRGSAAARDDHAARPRAGVPARGLRVPACRNRGSAEHARLRAGGRSAPRRRRHLCLGEEPARRWSCRTMPEYDLIIRNGSIIDGTGAPARAGDIAIEKRPDRGGRARDGDAHRARSMPRGHAVAPGFVDVHAHDDAAVVRDPRVDFKIMQGVTRTSRATAAPASRPRTTPSASTTASASRRSSATRTCRGRRRPSTSTRSTRRSRRATSPRTCRMASCATTSPVSVAGRCPRPNARACAQLVEEAMQAGAIGISTGLVYVPGHVRGYRGTGRTGVDRREVRRHLHEPHPQRGARGAGGGRRRQSRSASGQAARCRSRITSRRGQARTG